MPFETQAKPVAVSGGATIDAIDFRLTIRPMLSVSGRIVSDEAPGGFLTTRVTLTSNGATLWVNAGSDGKFRFPDVNPGTYQWSSSAGGAISGGNTIKVTDHDITGLEARVVLTQVRIRVSEEAVTHIDIHRRESSAGPLRLANEADRPLEFRGLQGGYLLVLRTASPLPLPDIGFSISSSAPVNMQVAAPRLHRVLLRTALEKGGPAPAFALNIDGMIAAAPAGRAGSDPAVLLRTQEVQLIGFSTDLVPSPDGTVSILLPEGNYRLGAGPARGATAPLRLKSIHSGGVDLERAPLTVSERDDIEIQIVLRR
jgi:hypothetical protein